MGTVITTSGSARITGQEIAASKLGIRMAYESYVNYHRYIGNNVEGFRTELIHHPQGAGVYAHVLGNAGLYLHGGFTGNDARNANRLIDFIQSFYKGQEGVSERAGNAAGKRVGEHMWAYLKGNRTQDDATKVRNDITATLCQ